MDEETKYSHMMNNLSNRLFEYKEENSQKLAALPLAERKQQLIDFCRKCLELFYGDDAKGLPIDDIQEMVIQMLTTIDKPGVCSYKYQPWVKSVWNDVTWSLSNRYHEYLLTKKKPWSIPSVLSINEWSDTVLDHCGNPRSKADFIVKGLVVGDIQSGKTANYTALINKAYDAGYKLIIVMAGLTNDLRSQTQARLDKEVLGCETKPFGQKGQTIGVGLVPGYTHHDICCITDAGKDGDLSPIRATYPFSNEGSCYLAVIKKNRKALDSILDFIMASQATQSDVDKKLPYPVLLVDDEADQASINTKKAKDVKEATSTNKKIRLIIAACHQVTYVGYTATPFANVFIDPFNDSDKYKPEEKDIFPSNFILTLPTPPGYSGSRSYFGVSVPDAYSDDTDYHYDLVREVDPDDFLNLSTPEDPQTKKKDAQAPDELPLSFDEAIETFLIGAGIKISRGIVENNTMLVHICLYTHFNSSLRGVVQDHYQKQCTAFMYDESVRQKYREFWEKKMKPVSQERLGGKFKDSWDKIEEGVFKAISWAADVDYEVKLLIGGADGETVDYSKTDFGMYVVVGGPKLSRGLTLDGLIVSYYYRRPGAYDTLLQMARWFGYREGWEDVCRVYTTKEIVDQFLEAAQAAENFKAQVQDMNQDSLTPEAYGLRVRASETMLPTSITKMRTGLFDTSSFSGQLQQTIDINYQKNDVNLGLAKDFLGKLKNRVTREGNSGVFLNVPSTEVVAFLKQFHNGNGKQSHLWAHYIEKLVKEHHELTNWTVFVSTIAKNNGDPYLGFPGLSVNKAQRKVRRDGIKDDTHVYRFKVVTAPDDFSLYFDDGDPHQSSIKEYGLKKHPELLTLFPPTNGLLGIYIFDGHYLVTEPNPNVPGQVKTSRGDYLPFGKSLIGLGVWFPTSKYEIDDARYIMNKIAQEQQTEQLNAWENNDDDK
jgi:hypothetical protein